MVNLAASTRASLAPLSFTTALTEASVVSGPTHHHQQQHHQTAMSLGHADAILDSAEARAQLCAPLALAIARVTVCARIALALVTKGSEARTAVKSHPYQAVPTSAHCMECVRTGRANAPQDTLATTVEQSIRWMRSARICARITDPVAREAFVSAIPTGLVCRAMS